jgi:hypothetical protein
MITLGEHVGPVLALMRAPVRSSLGVFRLRQEQPWTLATIRGRQPRRASWREAF